MAIRLRTQLIRLHAVTLRCRNKTVLVMYILVKDCIILYRYCRLWAFSFTGIWSFAIAYLVRHLCWRGLSVHTDEARFKCRINKPLKCPGLEIGKVKIIGNWLTFIKMSEPKQYICNLLIIKQTRSLNSQIYEYFWNKILHVSDSSSVHHQEFSTVTLQWYMSYRFAESLRAGLVRH